MTGGDSSGNGADWRLHPDPSEIESYRLRPHSPEEWVVGELREPEPAPSTPAEVSAAATEAKSRPAIREQAPAVVNGSTVSIHEPSPVLVRDPASVPARAGANRFFERLDRVDARLKIAEEKVTSSLRRTSAYTGAEG